MKRAAETWKWVRFECRAAVGAQVFISGTFNKWKPSCFHQLRDRHHDGIYRTLLQIKTGTHEYGYLVNGEASAGVEGDSGKIVLDVG